MIANKPYLYVCELLPLESLRANITVQPVADQVLKLHSAYMENDVLRIVIQSDHAPGNQNESPIHFEVFDDRLLENTTVEVLVGELALEAVGASYSNGLTNVPLPEYFMIPAGQQFHLLGRCKKRIGLRADIDKVRDRED